MINLEELGLSFKQDEDGLSLVYENMIMKGDFTKNLKRLKQNNLQSELLVKASKIKGKTENLIAIDATAGLGEDSLLLAAAGFYVKMYESNPVIFKLLEDTIKRATKIPELENIVSRMEIFNEDSINAMKNLNFKPDVILLDPMFPSREKSSLIKKKFQILQKLESPCENGKKLLEAAIAAKPQKVIIKRPAKAEFLGDIKPSYSIKGKSIRYDCIVLI